MMTNRHSQHPLMTSKKSHTGKTVLILAMLLLMGMAIRLWPERRSVGLDISTLGRVGS